MKIVETDNYGRDYPDEKFVNLPPGPKEDILPIVEAINNAFCKSGYSPRYWKMVNDDYKLIPGFEP